jgi:hypothetical protein
LPDTFSAPESTRGAGIRAGRGGSTRVSSAEGGLSDEKNRERYTLTSAAEPYIADGGKGIVQAKTLYKCLELYGSIYTLEQLIVAAKSRKYESTFKDENSATVVSRFFTI